MPIAFLIKLAGVAESLWRLLRSVAAWVFSDLRHVAIAVLLTGCAYWYFNANGLKAENEKLTGQLVSIKEAQKLATKLAKEEKARIEAENERKANDARELEKKLRSDYDARLARWLQNNRGSTGQANLPETGSPTQGTVRESGLAQLPEGYAIVPVNDLQLSAEAFAKLEALQNWAKSVIE